MTTFRFIHTADIHLDSPLKGLAGYDGPAAERIRTATRQAFDNLISEAIDQSVAFVLIHGDLYDGDWRDYQTGLFFSRQMGRLGKAKIPAFVLHGNHDAESQITKRLTLPEGVKTFPRASPTRLRFRNIALRSTAKAFGNVTSGRISSPLTPSRSRTPSTSDYCTRAWAEWAGMKTMRRAR